MNYDVTNHIEEYKVTSQEEHLSVVEQVEKVEVTSRELANVTIVQGGVKLSIDFDYNDVLTGSKIIGNLPTNVLCFKAAIEIENEFDGNTEITIGKDDATALFMQIADNDPTDIGKYEVSPDSKSTETITLKGFFSGTPTQGTGKIIIYCI